MNRDLRVLLAGNPNTGKTALFNVLTGGRSKIGNYSRVTVEKKEGVCQTPAGKQLLVLDLPGAYGLEGQTLDEKLTSDILLGRIETSSLPECIIAIVDASHLSQGLGFVLELKNLNRPMILALNMFDLATQRGLQLDLKKLSQKLGIAVIPTIATKNKGVLALLKAIDELVIFHSSRTLVQFSKNEGVNATRERFKEVDRILSQVIQKPIQASYWTEVIDRWVLHPFFGFLILILLFTLFFQGIFLLASYPMALIEAGFDVLAKWIHQLVQPGLLQSLLVDGILAGIGSAISFLPQMILLFFFIFLMEDSGYLPRATFLLNRFMEKVGLNGRALIPLLSSFACAIPGIMATRTIENRKDRLITILIAPLMTCAARLPVYSLLIAAFIPKKFFFGFLNLQGLVLLGLYGLGIILSLVVAWIFKRLLLSELNPSFIMELPTYKWPNWKNIAYELWLRIQLFIKKAGTLILVTSIFLWFFTSYPRSSFLEDGLGIEKSFAGVIGKKIEWLFRPIGFDWRIILALIPSFAAREVMVSALATVYSVEASGKKEANFILGQKLTEQWSLATGMSVLVWFVFACQCFSTLVVIQKETQSLKWPMVVLVYMSGLAYIASFITYQVVRRL